MFLEKTLFALPETSCREGQVRRFATAAISTSYLTVIVVRVSEVTLPDRVTVYRSVTCKTNSHIKNQVNLKQSHPSFWG